jgi:glucose-fructose oxidoreductase
VKRTSKKLRVAVVGLGHFAQAAVLPALQRSRNAELVAMVSGDPDKLRVLGDRYRVAPDARIGYAHLDRLLERDGVDAVYVALPNDLHADAVIRAAGHGCHVICEKPLAPSVEECEAMIDACEGAGVRLMVAYRLHFEAANLTAVDTVTRGELGEPRIFDSVFTMQVREGNVRVQPRPGAGPLFDLGVYCVNAARYLFRDEPVEVQAMALRHRGDPRFQHVEETIAATLRFPGDRVASFVASFGAADRARYEVIGTEGSLALENAYEYAADVMSLEVERGARKRTRRFRKRDQIAAEIEYFARCVRDGIDPEPSGREGLIDVRIMLAIAEAARGGRTVTLGARDDGDGVRPVPEQEVRVPPHGMPRTVAVDRPSK